MGVIQSSSNKIKQINYVDNKIKEVWDGSNKVWSSLNSCFVFGKRHSIDGYTISDESTSMPSTSKCVFSDGESYYLFFNSSKNVSGVYKTIYNTYKSNDLNVWTYIQCTVPDTVTGAVVNVTYAGDKFVAMLTDSKNKKAQFIVSDDCITWQLKKEKSYVPEPPISYESTMDCSPEGVCLFYYRSQNTDTITPLYKLTNYTTITEIGTYHVGNIQYNKTLEKFLISTLSDLTGVMFYIFSKEGVLEKTVKGTNFYATKNVCGYVGDNKIISASTSICMYDTQTNTVTKLHSGMAYSQPGSALTRAVSASKMASNNDGIFYIYTSSSASESWAVSTLRNTTKGNYQSIEWIPRNTIYSAYNLKFVET